MGTNTWFEIGMKPSIEKQIQTLDSREGVAAHAASCVQSVLLTGKSTILTELIRNYNFINSQIGSHEC